jgi:hypothetical protein
MILKSLVIGHVEQKIWYVFGCRIRERQVLEIILGVPKVISNYSNHIANTAVDAPFQNLFEK